APDGLLSLNRPAHLRSTRPTNAACRSTFRALSDCDIVTATDDEGKRDALRQRPWRDWAHAGRDLFYRAGFRRHEIPGSVVPVDRRAYSGRRRPARVRPDQAVGTWAAGAADARIPGGAGRKPSRSAAGRPR